MIERAVDFAKLRRMRCGACAHEWDVTGEWLDRFDQALEVCPTCGADCQGEDRPNFCAATNDPVRDDDTLRATYWYHSSTHENWPNRAFDPAARLTDETRQRMAAMLPAGGLKRWAHRQRTKALHIGTYEAAIENMFRRIDDQDGASEHFFLYRVRLRSDSVIEPGVHPEPTDFVGDAKLAEVTGPGINVYRYVNVHEDVSGISLAIELDAVDAVQQIALPLPVDRADSWVAAAIERLATASSKAPVPKEHRSPRFGLWRSSPLASEARALVADLAAGVPLPLRDRFRIGMDEAAFRQDRSAFPRSALGLARLITDPELVLAALDEQPWRTV